MCSVIQNKYSAITLRNTTWGEEWSRKLQYEKLGFHSISLRPILQARQTLVSQNSGFLPQKDRGGMTRKMRINKNKWGSFKIATFYPLNGSNDDEGKVLKLLSQQFVTLMEMDDKPTLKCFLSRSISNQMTSTFIYVSCVDFNDGKQPFHRWTNGGKPS